MLQLCSELSHYVLGHVRLQNEKTRKQEAGTARKCLQIKSSVLHVTWRSIIFDQSSAFKSRILRKGGNQYHIECHRLYDAIMHHHHHQNAISPAHPHRLAVIFACLTCFILECFAWVVTALLEYIDLFPHS